MFDSYELNELLHILEQSKEIVWDFETTSLHHKDMEIDGIAICADNLEPVFVWSTRHNVNYTAIELYEFMQKAFSLDALYIGHNLQFDIKVLQHFYQVRPNRIFDTMIASWYLDENRPKGLKSLGEDLLGIPMKSYSVHIKESKQELKEEAYAEAEKMLQFEGVKLTKKAIKERAELLLSTMEEPIEWLEKYAKLDVEVTYKLYKLFAPLLAEEPVLENLYYGLEMPFLNVLVDMTLAGIHVDMALLKEMEEYLSNEKVRLENHIYQELGEFNINSTQQLSEKLFGIAVSRKNGKITLTDVKEVGKEYAKPTLYTATNIPATSDAALEPLQTKAAELIREYRSINKLLETYVVGYQKFVYDGILYPNFNPAGTVTGRLSSSEPNCFDKETEILTYRGWVKFPNLLLNDLVAQWENGVITFVAPIGCECHQYTGDLISIQNNHIDLCMTPDHRCLLQNRKTQKFSCVSAENYLKDSKQLHGGMYEGTKSIDKNLITLIIATQADGYYNHSGIEFNFTKERKKDRLIKACVSLGVPYTNKSRIRLLKSETTEFLMGILGKNKEYGSWLLNFDRDTLDNFIEEISFWDGSFKRDSMYSSNNKTNADWVQIVYTLSNHRAKVREYTGSKNTNYQVDHTPRNFSLTTNHISYKTYYNDLVYCVKVPSSYIVVRRNGKTAVTGNCQNLPASKTGDFFIRDAFIAPPGYKLIVADESQLELRILAHYSQDPVLLEAFLSGKDIHAKTASDVLVKALEEVSSEERRFFKTINFGIMYGMGAAKLAASLGITEFQAQKLLNGYFKTYAGVPAFIKRTEGQMKKQGYIKTLLGRKRRIPQAHSSNKKEMFRAMRQTVNSKIQGSAADVLKAAMIKIYDEFKDTCIDAQILLQIHDELVCRVHEKDVEQACDIIKRHMEHPFGKDLLIPLVTEPKICDNWGQGKD